MTNEYTITKSQFGHWVIVISFVIGAWSLVIPHIANANASSVSAIQSTYQSIQDLSADFAQSTYVEVLDSTIKEPGIFLMKKPMMLRIEYTGEHPKQYISNGKKLWIMDKDLKQVETYNSNSIPKEALEFLKGFGEMKKLFKVETWLSKKPIQGHTYLKLTPKGKSPQYRQLDCEFGPDNILKTMTIHNKSGNISTYVFSNIKVNKGLDDSLFRLEVGGIR